MIQLYAPFHPGPGSFKYLGQQIANALARDRLNGAIYATGTMSPDYPQTQWGVSLFVGASTGIFIGYPPSCSGWLAKHDHKILVTASETDRVPPEWIHQGQVADLLVVPSEWSAQAFRTCGWRKEIMVLPHGADPALLDMDGPQWGRTARLLHVAGAPSFPERKGTAQLLEAFAQLHKEGAPVELTIRTDSCERIDRTLKYLGHPPVTLAGGPHQNIWNLYRNCDAIVAPSRGEAFGLVPLEARMAGRVAILTPGHGHAAHVQPCDVPIQEGPLAPLKGQDGQHGNAPTVTTEAVYAAIRNYLRDRMVYHTGVLRWRLRYGSQWSWNAKLRPLVRRARAMERGIVARANERLAGAR